MKKLIPILLILAACNQPKKQVASTEIKPVSDACVLTATISDPKHPADHPMHMCMYTHTETRGIYVATACVGVLIEGQTGTRLPFYGSKGHWGIEGNCSAEKITAKLNDPQTMKTVNPISDLKSKRKSGMKVTVDQDDYKIGNLLLEVTKP